MIMKIKTISVFQVDLPLHEGSYKWSEGKSVSVFDSTVLIVTIDQDLYGVGEVCPLGSAYLPSYPEGVRTGIRKIGPDLIGEDATNLGRINEIMDRNLKGHLYVKSAIDMACWDILGKVSGLPVCNLLGGRYGDTVQLYRAISQEAAHKMADKVSSYRAEGYRRFQLKVGGKPREDIDRIRSVAEVMEADDILVADANTGWLKHEAIRVVNAVKGLDVYIEQPCTTYEECLSVRRKTDHPFILDECIDSLPRLLQGYADQAMDVINIKISKFGGLTKASRIRDVCVELGIAMTIEDSWGGDIVTAAIAHLAHSTPERYRFTATDFNSYVTVSFAKGAPQREQGTMSASFEPGLGVIPDMAVLGEPAFVVK